jgi:hypothetical protein
MFAQLLEVPAARRDETWHQSFLSRFASEQVAILNPQPQQGPDGWPYLLVTSNPDSEMAKAVGAELEPVAGVLAWLSDRGIGLVLNPERADEPDFLFPYGVIWNHRETGSFFTDPSTTHFTGRPDRDPSERVTVKPGERLRVGPVDARILPPYVRQVLKRFWADQGVFAPKAAMVSLNGATYDLAFSLESLRSPPAHEHQQLAEAIGWFLPAHYSVLLLSEKALGGVFEPL